MSPSNPPIQCVQCGKERGLFDYELNEAATLKCPTCGTEFLITAAIKEPVNKDPNLPNKPVDQIDRDSSPSPSFGGGDSVLPPPPPPAESAQAIANLIENVKKGMSAEEAVERFMEEAAEKDKSEWKGGLASFNTKIGSLAKELGFLGDLGDLVRELQEADALKLSGETVKLDLNKMRTALVKHLVTKGSKADLGGMGGGGVDIHGDLLDGEEGDSIDDIASSMPEGSPMKVTREDVEKAIRKYFG